ncbi:MAG TPA: adenosylmethionine--8-amino-7-oxononanoate transaminase [Cyclobacteriaceae bacterium]|nr:adenosylmethionine--8-amino-7-oxononanoate transaminase [Cyclobacteriaceae bacterium]
MSLRDDDLKNIWHPFSPIGGEPPIVVTSAQGIYLHCEDGRKLIDGISSWWVNIHGHSHPAIAEAIYKQAKVLEHVIFAGFTHPPAIQLSKNLLSILPSNQSKIFFSDNGSTAVEVALKMAIQYWHNKGTPKRRVIAIEGSYHGDTFGSMSVGDRGMFTEPFSKHLFDAEFIPWPDGTNDDQAIKKFRGIVETGDVFAFIYEPLVQGAGGMRTYSPKLLSSLMEIARKAGVLCIADEVFTGFGRTGPIFSSEHIGIMPDLMALSKGLTGGTMALGVTTCSQQIFDAFNSNELSKTFFHGHSFTANPIACASANASFDLLMAKECRERIKTIAAAQTRYAATLRGHPLLAAVNSLGTILSLEVKTESGTSYGNNLKHEIYRFFLDRGILLRPLGNVIYFLPSYVFTEKELGVVYAAIDEFLDQLESR